MAGEISNLLGEVLASPLGDVIASVGAGVAAAQRSLDEAAVAQTLEIYSEGGEELVQLLRSIGYRPTFYALPETVGEVNVSMRLSNEAPAATTSAPAPADPATARALTDTRFTALSAAPKLRTYVTPVDAGFANKYNFAATASAKLTFKIVPIPPPAGVEDLRVVPNLAGRSVAIAREVLDALDLEARIVNPSGAAVTPRDDAPVMRMEPAAGGVVRLGAVIELIVKG